MLGKLLGFQSTPPVKAATAAQYLDTRTLLISIHAAREGGDPQTTRLSVALP